MTDATAAASAAAAGAAAAMALQIPEPGVLIFAAIGAAASAVAQAPPDDITWAWVRLAVARFVGFVGCGVLAPYLAPSVPGLAGLGAAPQWAVALAAAWLAPAILGKISGGGK